MENQGTNEDHSQSEPHPEAGIFRSQITQNSGPEIARDRMGRGLQRDLNLRGRSGRVNPAGGRTRGATDASNRRNGS